MSGKLTRHSNCGKLVVSYGTVFALHVSLARKQQARRKPRGPFESCPQLRTLVSENIL
jgi:hypothetical protein